MERIVAELNTVSNVTTIKNETANLAGFLASIGEAVFLVTNASAAIRAACPVINAVIIPVIV